MPLPGGQPPLRLPLSNTLTTLDLSGNDLTNHFTDLAGTPSAPREEATPADSCNPRPLSSASITELPPLPKRAPPATPFDALVALLPSVKTLLHLSVAHSGLEEPHVVRLFEALSFSLLSAGETAALRNRQLAEDTLLAQAEARAAAAAAAAPAGKKGAAKAAAPVS